MPSLLDVYHRLHKALGPQEWWPAESPFEMMLGAVLVQNTAWKNVEKAIRQLREEGVLSVTALYKLADNELEELIRPAGYFRVKAKRLRNLLKLIVNEYESDVDMLLSEDTGTLREKLLSVNGIGPETADSILLYAAERPKFVIDAYTYRILARHGWSDYETDYHQMQELFEQSLPDDTQMFNEYHALLVAVGKEFCRKTTPKCEHCPLCDMLPENGIIEPM